MPRRSKILPQARVPLSETERACAEVLAALGRKHLREDALRLLAEGAPEHDLHDLRRVVTTSLCGHKTAQGRWGAFTARALELAADRVRHLQDSALWVVVVHETGDWRGPGEHVSYLGCIWGPPGSGLAWPCGWLGDPNIKVRRYPEPKQLDLFEDSDD